MLQRTILLLLAVVSITNAVTAQATPPSAATILSQATQKAASENKKVFILFHASWCGWCHRMDSLMNSPACKKLFNDNYVIAHIDVQETGVKKNLENPGGVELLNKYHGEGAGIPYWLVFDAKGNFLADSRLRSEVGVGATTEVGDNTGCPSAKDEVDYFISVLKHTSSLTADQLKTIETTFWMK